MRRRCCNVHALVKLPMGVIATSGSIYSAIVVAGLPSMTMTRPSKIKIALVHEKPRFAVAVLTVVAKKLTPRTAKPWYSHRLAIDVHDKTEKMLADPLFALFLKILNQLTSVLKLLRLFLMNKIKLWNAFYAGQTVQVHQLWWSQLVEVAFLLEILHPM